jgi:hypothetical protein
MSKREPGESISRIRRCVTHACLVSVRLEADLMSEAVRPVTERISVKYADELLRTTPVKDMDDNDREVFYVACRLLDQLIIERRAKHEAEERIAVLERQLMSQEPPVRPHPPADLKPMDCFEKVMD